MIRTTFIRQRRLFVVFGAASVIACAALAGSGCSSTVQGGGNHVGGGAGTNGQGGSTATGGSSSAGTSSGGSAGAPLLACVAGRVTGENATVTGSTDGASNAFTTSCGSGSSPDIAWEWTAPKTDYYVFDTVGSSFDTVLALRDGGCQGNELACNDNNGSSPQSKIVQKVNQGELIVAIVDGNVGEQGSATLNIDRVTCPSTDLTSQPLPALLTTVGGQNVHTGACGGDGNPEKAIRYTPDSAGLYRFSVAEGAAFTPALYLEQGPVCGGSLLQCNTTPPSGYATEITRWLPAGVPVTAIVDSASGSGAFSLNISKSTQTCPTFDMATANLDNVTLDATTASDVLSGSCVPAGSLGYGGRKGLVDHSYGFTENNCPTCACTLQITSDNPVAAYLLKGKQCDGPETKCQQSTGSGTSYTTSFSFSEADNGDYVLVIENLNPDALTITYSIAQFCIA